MLRYRSSACPQCPSSPARATLAHVRLDPYPHLVIDDALHPDTYAQLAAWAYTRPPLVSST